jgi:hypothetical protein
MRKNMTMSKQTTYSIIGFCAVVGLFVAIKLLPGIWLEHERDKAVKAVVDQAARDAVREVATDAVRDTARMLALNMVRDASKPNPLTTTTTQPNASSTNLDRLGYTITLPDGSTLDPQDKDLDKDHFTTANLPNHGSLIIVAIDDKSRAPAAFEKTVANLQAKLQSPTTSNQMTVESNKVTRSSTIRGIAKGESFVFEIFQFDGPKRSCLIICEYPQSTSADAAPLFQKTLATLQFKD